MPIYAINETERNRYYPDSHDEATWFDYRRITLEKEMQIDALCTVRGNFDRFKKLNLMCAWGLVGWAGFGEGPGGPAIPYDFASEFEEGGRLPNDWKWFTDDQQRKLHIVSKLPRDLKIEIVRLMTATHIQQERELGNFEPGLHAAEA